MKFLFGVWEVKYLYFTCLLFSICEGSSEPNCTFHIKYCFFVERILTPISTVADLDKLCRVRSNAWPLEIYDAKLQKSLDKYLSFLDTSYSLKTVFLNVERSPGGWQYIQDYDRNPTFDLKAIAHHGDVAFYDTFVDKVEAGWVNYFQLPYVCSYKLSSSQCNQTDTLVTSDLCFTRHEDQLKWIQALNDCRSRNGYLALMKYRHKDALRQWLESTSNDMKHWWIGLAWRPLKWRKKGTIVTWWNLPLETMLKSTPHEVHFQIEGDNNQWKVEKNINSSDLVVCMTEHLDICSGKECQAESKRMIPVVEISIVVVVVVVAIVATVVAIRLWLRKKKRREISKRTEEAGPFKTIPDPCPGKQPIYLQPLPDIYEKTNIYHSIDQNQYEQLNV